MFAAAVRLPAILLPAVLLAALRLPFAAVLARFHFTKIVVLNRYLDAGQLLDILDI